MAFELRHIYKNYGDKNIFTNFCHIFPEARTTAIMGPSGAGKTTLINIILGITWPDHGQVCGLADKRISVVFQEDRLLEHKSGLNNILFVLREPALHVDRALELLGLVGLADDAHKKARDYSGGMRRRLALCRALITDFDILILDEPFKGLDEILKPKVMAMVKEQSRKSTVILVTHDKSEAEFLGSRIIDISPLR